MKKWISLLLPVTVILSLIIPGVALGADPVGLALTKVADKNPASLGDTITYTYEITNTTSGDVTELALTDSKLGAITLAATTLAAGAKTTGTATYVVVAADFPGPITNTAAATGKDAAGAAVSADITLSVTLNPYQAALTVSKTADKSSASPHETINYSYTITNTGPVAISELKLTDSKLGAITLTTATLNPGQSTTATKAYLVTIADLPGPIVNTAAATGKDPSGTAVTATSASVSVTLTVNKSLLTKAEILKLSGVPGKGIMKAPGLQKPFNPKSRASEKAGKKK